MPIGLADARVRWNLKRRLTASDRVFFQACHRRSGQRRAATAASAAAAESAAAHDTHQCARRVRIESLKFDLLHGHVGAAAVGDDHGHFHRLARHDDAIVGERLDIDGARGEDRLLELGFLLAQPKIDFEARGIVDVHASKLSAQRPNRVQPRGERHRRRFIRVGVELFLRFLDRRGD